MVKVVVFGATGPLGCKIAIAMAKAGHETFVVLRDKTSQNSDKQTRIDALNAAGISLLEIDMLSASVEQLSETLKGSDAVVSVVGGAALAAQPKLVEAAEAAGVKRFLPSEFGMDFGTVTEMPRALQPLLAKRAARKALRASGLEYTFVIAYGFMDSWVPALGTLGKPTPPNPVRIFGSGDNQAFVATHDDIAAVTAKAVDDPRTANKTLHIRGGAVSQNHLAALYERIFGKTLQRQTVTAEDLDKVIAEGLATGNPFASVLPAMEKRFWLEGGCEAAAEVEAVEAAELYPDVRFTTAEDYLQQLAGNTSG